ncbi:MAG: hypothetical protein OET16_05425, partial [Chromatiales bacterium]|nr:hypothetical protein [Chromatiales bacterium]
MILIIDKSVLLSTRIGERSERTAYNPIRIPLDATEQIGPVPHNDLANRGSAYEQHNQFSTACGHTGSDWRR